MKLHLKKGTTSKLLQLFVPDSASATGAGLTGLVFNTSGLTAYYYREGAAGSTQITLATMTVGTWASGGFKEVDATNLPGVYQLGIPDAALASGANSVIVMLKGAANMAPVVLEIQLTDIDVHDATRGGMTALPNANAAANGGVPTVDANNAVKVQSGTGANQVDLSSGRVRLQDGTLAAATFAAGAIDANAIATDAIGSAELATSAVAEIAAAVNAEVVDALAVDTYAEPSAVPAATVSLAAKIGWLFTLARNRILQTSTAQTLKADNGTTDIATAAVSDNGSTFERSEWA